MTRVTPAPSGRMPSASARSGTGVVTGYGFVHRPRSGPPIRLQAASAWRADNPSAAVRAILAVAEEAPAHADGPGREPNPRKREL